MPIIFVGMLSIFHLIKCKLLEMSNLLVDIYIVHKFSFSTPPAM